MIRGYPPAGYIDAAWWEVASAPLRAERMTRDAWVDQLAAAYQLIRIPASLTPAQLAVQQDMAGRLLGRKFFTVTPMEGWL
jgi:hypothetical protein